YPRACTVWEQTSSSLAPHLTEIFFFFAKDVKFMSRKFAKMLIRWESGKVRCCTLML
uniref:Uncharacterized protein n=2 Tax=Sus scrofa TaxID=9823 RepID=A0A5G2QCP9_PIG